MGDSLSRLPLLGRSGELDRVIGLLDRIPGEQGQFALIEGEAGIGKTALLQEVLRAAGARGFQVFAAAAGELGRDLPFGTLAEALGIGRTFTDPIRLEIADLLVGEIGVRASLSTFSEIPGIRFRVLESVLALLERLCLSAPVVLAVENLHWADPSTVLCLGYLARRLAHMSLVLIGTTRPSSQPSELRSLDQLVPKGGLLLVLPPLDEESVTALVEHVLGLPPGPDLMAAVAGAGGNPLYVKEFLSALEREGAIEVVQGHAELRARVLPPSLRVIILKQLGALSPDAIDALRVASVLGSTFSVTDLAVVLGKGSAALLSLLDQALRTGVLGEAGDRLRFRHELVREAIYSDLTAAVRSALHAQAGSALADVGAPASQVATHLALGARPGDRTAAEWLARAGREAGPGSPDVAIDLLQRAVDLLPPLDPGRDRLLVDLARALLLAGRAEEAEKLTRHTLASEHDGSIDGALRFMLARSLIVEGRMSEAADEMARAVEDASLSEDERTRLLAEAALARAIAGRLAGTDAMADEARRRAAGIGDLVGASVALGASCITNYFHGHLEVALSFGRQAVLAADETPGLEGHHALPRLFLGVALIDLDRVKESEEVLQTGRVMADRVAPHFMRHAYHLALAVGHFHVGEWDDAIAEIETALSVIGETGVRSGSVWARSALGLIALHRGDLQTAGFRLAEAERDFATVGPQFLADWMPWVLALLHEARGEPEQGLAVLSNAWDMCIAVGLTSELRTLGPDLVRMTLIHGDTQRAISIASAVEEAATRADVPSLEGAARRCRGLCERDPDILLSSVAAYRRSPRQVEQALTCEDAAMVLGEVGRSEEAVTLLREAVEVYERLGAVRDLARVDSHLRLLGVHRGRRGGRRRPATGWDSLTPSEREVVRLATEGLTNAEIGERLFISRRTVETHLSHIFGKVGVSSRVQLAAEAARRVI